MPARILWFTTAFNLVIFPFVIFHLLILKTPYFSSIKPFVVVSGSMEPVIPTGSLIYAIKEPKYHVGDVVTFSLNHENITHRIVKKIIIGGETYFSTKGDANPSADIDLVHKSKIFGKITTILPVLGRAIMVYKNPFGFYLGTVVPALLLGLFIFARSRKDSGTLQSVGVK